MSEISKQALKVDNSTSFPNNTTGYISPTILRAFNVNMIDSLVEQTGYNANSASWNVSIGALNTYTSSFAPSLTQLNAFTASQLTINTGYNGFTQSANASITRLDTFSSSFNAYTSSINQIRSNGVTLGTSTIFNLVGPGTFFSASLVQNVQGNIATLTFTSDNAKVNTSSFNDYTASTNAAFNSYTQSINQFSASANVSILALNQYTASDDTSMDALNAFTQSADQKLTSLISATGSYATTGSNTFVAGQTIKNGGMIIEDQFGFISIQRNQEGSGSQYPVVNISLDSANYVVDGVIGSFYVQDTPTSQSIALGINTYSNVYGFPNPVPMIFGQGNITGGDDTLIGFPAGRIDMWRPTNISGNLNVTGSSTLSGSSRVIGNQTITGSLLVSGSGTNDLTVVGQIFVSSSATGGTTAPKITISGSNGQTIINRSDVNTTDATYQAALTAGGTYASTISTLDEIGFAINPVYYTNWSKGPAIYVNNDAGDNYNAVFGFQNKANYTDGRVEVLTPLVINTGSLTITGSTYGNVISASIVSSTASIDLSKANYFTLTLPTSASTNINVLNPKPGNTAILRITTAATSSVTFSSNVLQPTGSRYFPTQGTNTDILTLSAFDTSSVYIVSANQFS